MVSLFGEEPGAHLGRVDGRVCLAGRVQELPGLRLRRLEVLDVRLEGHGVALRRLVPGPDVGDGIHLVVDEHGQFREDNFTTAMAVLQNAGDAGKGDQRGKKGGMKGGTEGSNIFKIVIF